VQPVFQCTRPLIEPQGVGRFHKLTTQTTPAPNRPPFDDGARAFALEPVHLFCNLSMSSNPIRTLTRATLTPQISVPILTPLVVGIIVLLPPLPPRSDQIFSPASIFPPIQRPVHANTTLPPSRPPTFPTRSPQRCYSSPLRLNRPICTLRLDPSLSAASTAENIQSRPI
jgi:hypothetical protein